MNAARVLLQSAALAGINLCSVVAAFVVYTLVRPAHQLLFQAFFAGLVSVVLFALWLRLTQPSAACRLRGRQALVIYFLAFLWAPALFVPLHYMTRGYLTSFSNITALWLFQAPVNVVAIAMAGGKFREKAL